MYKKNTTATHQTAPNAATEGIDHFNFGCWQFQADSGDLSDGYSTTRLEPQVARLLEYFLRHQHRVLSRDELISSAWKNRTVSDDAISRCVSILRQFLSPEDKNAYIETVVRKGYIAHFPPAPDEAATGEVSLPRRTRILLLAALGCMAVVALYLAIANLGESTVATGPSPAGPPLLAVLPFTTTGRGDEARFFSQGIHNDLITRLSQLQSMRVISQTSVMYYEDGPRNLRQIGQELGADVILEGTVQTSDQRIRINAQLIDVRDDHHLWGASYDRDLSPENIFEVQSEIARAIAIETNTTLTSQDKAQLALIPTTNMAAYRAYHRALEIKDTPEAGVTAPGYLESLEEAVALDPGFTRAWAELVSLLTYLNLSGDRPEMTVRAEEALQQLRALAPDSPDHLIGQAAYVYYALRDYDRAKDIISRVLAVNPGDVRALELQSLIERRQGDIEAHLASRREASRLDPRNPALQAQLLTALFVSHRYDELQTEVEQVTPERSTTAFLQGVMQFREHRDFQRLQDSMREACQFFTEPDCGWATAIANRDYTSAVAALKISTGEMTPFDWGEHRRRQIMTDWLLKRDEELPRDMSHWRQLIEQERQGPAERRWFPNEIDWAMLAGMEGKREEAERLVIRWLRQRPIDWAERIQRRHFACRALGMIAATRSALNCLDDGLAEASFIAPFLEPYLPYYDALRERPEFIAWLAAIDGEQPAESARTASVKPGQLIVAEPDRR